MNRENMEKWIEALENYEGEPARNNLRSFDGTLCAIGIGVFAMTEGNMPRFATGLMDAASEFRAWLGLPKYNHGNGGPSYDVELLDEGLLQTVTAANDLGLQSPWTIAQRLRASYLKEES